MKNLKTIAAMATLAATMAFTASAGISLPGKTYTVEQCDNLSQQIDAAHQDYQAALNGGSNGQINKTLKKYNDLNSLYNQVCFGVPHTY